MEKILLQISSKIIFRFRFLDIQYNRNEDYKTIILPQNSHSNEKKSLDIEDAAEKLNEPELKSGSTKKPEATLLLNDDKEIETTVIFLPNIWSLMPTSIEYQKIVDAYKNFIENPPLQITKSLVTENKPKQPEPKSQTEENLKQMEPEVLNETNKLQEDEEEKVDDSDTNGPVEVNSIEELTKSLKAHNTLLIKNFKSNFYLLLFILKKEDYIDYIFLIKKSLPFILKKCLHFFSICYLLLNE